MSGFDVFISPVADEFDGDYFGRTYEPMNRDRQKLPRWRKSVAQRKNSRRDHTIGQVNADEIGQVTRNV